MVLRYLIYALIYTSIAFNPTLSSDAAEKILDLKEYCTRVSVFENTEVCLFSEGMFRVRTSSLQGEKFPDKYMIPFVVGKLENWPSVSYQLKDTEEGLIIDTAKISIRFNANDKSWSVWSNEGKGKIHPSDGVVRGIFKNGYSLFDSASAFNEINNNSRYAHYFYNPETRNYTDVYLESDEIFDQYFVYGPDYKTLFKQVNELIGPEPLLPKKAYGFFQTQHLACAGTQGKLMEVAKMLRERDIPADTLIFDFEWGDGCVDGQEITWGSKLDWANEYSTPLSPRDMLKELKDMNYDVMVIRHNAPNFANRHNQGWTETIVDEDAWWDAFDARMDEGVRGAWQDTRQNDLTDSVIWSAMQNRFKGKNRVLFMGARKMQSVNPWDFRLSTVPVNQVMGSRRYPFDWTGDPSFSWNEFKWQIHAITNTHGSMKGINYISSDTVGANWKIQARWNQFTDFTTISRSHHRKPWQGNFDTKNFENKIKIDGRENIIIDEEPSVTEEGSENAEESIRKHRKIRYKILPYIYSYSIENYLTGMPVARPMLLAYPDDYFNNADNWPYQYMFGEELLVAPVYGDFNSMEIYLPQGIDWIDYWNHDIYKEGGLITYDTSDINKLPLFIKAGAIIPNRQEMNWIDTAVVDQIIFDIYPTTSSSFDFYEDDNITIDYQDGAIAKTTIKVTKHENNNIHINLAPISGSFDGMPVEREYGFSVNLLKKAPKEVVVNNVSESGWDYDATKGNLFIKSSVKLSDGLNIDIITK